MLHNKKLKKGIALYLTILILSLLSAIGIGLSQIVFTQIKVIREIGYSVNALCAAGSGVERALYELYVNGITSGSFSDSFEGSSYSVTIFQAGTSQCPSPPFEFYCIKSQGEFKGILRSVEAGF